MINLQNFNYILQNEKYYYNITINSDDRNLIDLYECNIKFEIDNRIIKDLSAFEKMFLDPKLSFFYEFIVDNLKYTNENLHTFILKSISKEFKQQRKSKSK